MMWMGSLICTVHLHIEVALAYKSHLQTQPSFQELLPIDLHYIPVPHISCTPCFGLIFRPQNCDFYAKIYGRCPSWLPVYLPILWINYPMVDGWLNPGVTILLHLVVQQPRFVYTPGHWKNMCLIWSVSSFQLPEKFTSSLLGIRTRWCGKWTVVFSDESLPDWSWIPDSSMKNGILKVAGFDQTCSDMYLLGVYRGKIMIFSIFRDFDP